MILKGEFHPDFGQVAESLIRNIERHSPGGAALCIYHHGEKVVDVWGGTRDVYGTPWESDTVAFSASSTKAVPSTLLHILVDQGKARYDDRVADHWPAFAQNGKQDITLRQALSHQAGLYNIADHGMTIDDFHDWEASLRALEQARPAHRPGKYSAYHALTYGPLAGGLVEKIAGKPFQTVMNELLVEPLGLDGLFIGVPDEHLHRVAKLIAMDGHIGHAYSYVKALPGPLRSALSAFDRLTGGNFSHTVKALMPPFADEMAFNEPMGMQALLPAVNGAFTARSLARMYAAIAQGGELDGVRIMSRERLRFLQEQQTAGPDRVVNFPMGWRMGYHQVYSLGPRSPDAFGHFGFGGSGGWCDPSRELSLAMTLNTCIGTGLGELRFALISGDVLRCADRRERWRASA